VLVAEAVSHHYLHGGPLVLDRLDLRVDDGDTVAVVGPSGSGKSTLLAVLGLLLAPSSGTVRLGDPPHAVGPADRPRLGSRIGWVFQGSNALLGRTVVDNVALPLVLDGHRRSVAEQRAVGALGLVGLAGFADRPARSLSGGELQRMCIARAVVGEPDVLLADEPTGQLDATNSALVADALVAGATHRSCLVLVTHDPAVAARCGRRLALQLGRLVPA
jgi:predicted ABC-type transport system involved in lysophospholipase L1 biosynthesis ATPase subunit